MSRRYSVPAAFAAVVVVTAVWGHALDERLHMHMPAAPLFARWGPRLSVWTVVALAVAVAVVVCTPRARSLSFARLAIAGGVAAAAWGIALAFIDGGDGLTRGITGPHGYLVQLDRMGDVATFVRTFVDDIARYTVHVRGHPPGITAVLLALHHVGLATPTILASVLIVAGASIVPATMITIRCVAGEEPARRSAPFLVLAPAAIWLVTSFDALYAAVGAWAVAILVVAGGKSGRTSDLLAVAGGLLFGLGVFGSYGLVLLVVVPVILLSRDGRYRVLVLAAVGGAAVIAAFAASGFWLIDGALATRAEYLKGIASVRPYSYFAVANLAAFGIAAGAGAMRGLAEVKRHPRVLMLCAATLLAVAIADLSGMSKGEVERIWLPFVPLVIAAASAIPGGEARMWLGAQAAITIGTATVLRVPW